jgi:DNA-binding CsgD family transcriptional regulator
VSRRVAYGRVVHAFIRAGWNPPRPDARAAGALIDAIDAVHPAASLELSPRETQILELLAEGLTYQEIATRIGISHETVKRTNRGMRERLGARNAAHAVAIGFRIGLLE